MDLKEITNRNYSATVKRGLITKKTTTFEFIKKIQSETIELNDSWLDIKTFIEFDEIELADIILVCLAMAKHYDIDIQKVLTDKVIFNENRKD